MRSSVIACGLAVAAIACPSAQAAAIDHGRITVGRGAAGARLDMTRAQVIHKLGVPVAENANGLMSYQPDGASGIFDVYRYLDTKRVRMFVLAGFHGRSWRLADGNAIFARRSIARLYRHYGTRVHRVHDATTDDRTYVIKSTYRHRPVETQFLVDRFSRTKARVLDVFILFTDRGA
jgi:hypothetical protein